jgi:nitroreductase
VCSPQECSLFLFGKKPDFQKGGKMTVLTAIRERRSVRKYKSDAIPEDVLLRVLEAARLAPSGKNLQPWKFILVKNKELKEKLAMASAEQLFIAQAPVIVVGCGYPDSCYARMGRYMKSWPVDVTIALEHLILQAQEEGLGTCWVGSFEEDEIKSILNIPENVRVLALTPLGYPDEEPPFRSRKSLKEIISYNRY